MKSSWYHEPWAWLVFMLPLTAVIAGISTYFIANNDPDPMVVGDYYKKGKAINLELNQLKQAQKLGMKFELKAANNELLIRPTGIDKTFPVLIVNFYHSTLDERDFTLNLTQDAQGDFRHELAEDIKGKWLISISTFNADWKIESNISLPQSDFIVIEPRFSQSKDE
jgi:hypothetical protein